MRVHWFAFVAALVSSGGGSLSSAQEASRPVTDHGVLEWIHNSEGGYIHPDQELRVDPEIGSLGIFATKFIPKGTVLCQVPWSIVIKSDDPEEEGQMCCGTVKSVAREMKKGNESEFGPYVEYLNAQPNDDIPSAWSDMGQELFRAIAGGKVEDTLIPPEEPTEWLIYDWYGRCRGSRVDKLAAKAAMLVVQRSDDAIMIPGKYALACFLRRVWRILGVVGLVLIISSFDSIPPRLRHVQPPQWKISQHGGHHVRRRKARHRSRPGHSTWGANSQQLQSMQRMFWS